MALTVPERGAPCKSANSPNDSPTEKVLIFFPSIYNSTVPTFKIF